MSARQADRLVVAGAVAVTLALVALAAAARPDEALTVLLGVGKLVLVLVLPVMFLSLALTGAWFVGFRRGWDAAMQQVARTEAARARRPFRSVGVRRDLNDRGPWGGESA